MQSGNSAKLLRIHLCENDVHNGTATYEHVVAKCLELGIAGATVFRGLEGFGETAEVHRPSLVHKNYPIVVVVIDQADRLERLINELEMIMNSGVIAMSDVHAIRVNRNPPR